MEFLISSKNIYMEFETIEKYRRKPNTHKVQGFMEEKKGVIIIRRIFLVNVTHLWQFIIFVLISRVIRRINLETWKLIK
jgi:hypothetical protein